MRLPARGRSGAPSTAAITAAALAPARATSSTVSREIPPMATMGDLHRGRDLSQRQEADDGIGVRLGLGRKHGAEPNVVRAAIGCGPGLNEVVGRDADAEVPPEPRSARVEPRRAASRSGQGG